MIYSLMLLYILQSMTPNALIRPFKTLIFEHRLCRNFRSSKNIINHFYRSIHLLWSDLTCVVLISFSVVQAPLAKVLLHDQKLYTSATVIRQCAGAGTM